MPLSQEHRAFQERLRKVVQEKIAPGAEEIDRTNRFPACLAVGNEAIQVFGGHTNLNWYHPSSRALRDLKIAATGGGSARNIRLSIIGRGLFA